jgi:hypothetical protein
VLRDWLAESSGSHTDPLFVSNRDQRLSRDAVEQIVLEHVKAASAKCPSLKKKRVTPHVLRHSAAMQLLQNGVDRTVIALWLGHESVETTQMDAISATGHVWTAPGCQELSARLQRWSVQPCVRPLNAAHVAAGHNAFRGSGPGQFLALDSAVAQVGCPDHRIDPVCITCCRPSPCRRSISGWGRDQPRLRSHALT